MNSNDNTHDPLQGQQHKDVSMVDVNNLHESLSQMSIDDNSFGSMQGFAPLTRQNDTQTSLNTQSTINSASHTPQPSAQVQNSDYQQQSQADHGNTSGNAATNSPLPPLGRRRSTMIFSDDYDVPEFRENAGTVNDISDDERINHDGVYGGAPNSQTNQQKQATSSNSYSLPNQQFSSSSSSSASFPSRPGSSQQQQQQQQQQERPVLVPVSIKWEQGGNSVYVTGSFTDWRKMIALTKNQEEPHIFSIVLQLPPGNHRFRFIVDGELRISDFLPQATDQLGNIVNFLEVSSPYSSTSMANSSNDSTVVAGTKNNNNNNNNDSSAVKRHQGEGSPEYPHKQPGQQSNAYQQQNDQSQYEQQQQQQQQKRGQAANANKRHAYKIAGSGFTSLEDEAKESSTDQQHQHAQMSKSSRLALQIAAENDQEPEDIGNGFSRVRPGDNKPLLSSSSSSKAQYQYTTDIPAVFTDPHVMEQYYLTLDQQRNNQQYMSWLTPPLLPPHLEKVILNASYSTPSTNNLPKQDSNGNNGHQHRHHHHHSHHHRTHQQNSTGSSDSSISSSQMSVDKQPSPQPPANSDENNSGALPIPNHVVLNHLITSSIKHNTLCVACTVRYKSKYATQILYAPL
ncbi:hypothetical protein ACO0QE_000865 [Hanseniaspora vineae]